MELPFKWLFKPNEKLDEAKKKRDTAIDNQKKARAESSAATTEIMEELGKCSASAAAVVRACRSPQPK